MATVLIDSIPDYLATLLFLQKLDAAQVDPDPAGYVLSSTTNNWEYSANIPEALAGMYRMEVWNDDGQVINVLYIRFSGETTLRPRTESIDAVDQLNGTTWTDEEANSFILEVTK